VDYKLEDQKAAGTPIKVLVYFETEKLGDFSDELTILNEDGFSIKVKLHAY